MESLRIVSLTNDDLQEAIEMWARHNTEEKLPMHSPRIELLMDSTNPGVFTARALWESE